MLLVKEYKKGRCMFVEGRESFLWVKKYKGWGLGGKLSEKEKK